LINFVKVWNFDKVAKLHKTIKTVCKITNKIKFCTCKATDTDKLKHYWCLNRYNKNSYDFAIVGSMVMGNVGITLDYEVNKVILEQRLNDAEAFDMDLRFEPKDVL
jgi:hypothetical protein